MTGHIVLIFCHSTGHFTGHMGGKVTGCFDSFLSHLIGQLSGCFALIMVFYLCRLIHLGIACLVL